MGKKKILHVSYGGLGRGGVSSVILSITEPLRDDFDFGCVVFQTVGEREAIFSEYGTLHRLACYSKNGKRSVGEIILRPFRMFFGIRSICKTYGYDGIHVHNGEYEGLCLWAARLAGVGLRIAHSHNTPSPQKDGLIKRGILRMNRRFIQKNATYKVGCSELACRSFFGTEDYRVIYNSVDLSRFDFRKREPHDGIRFIHVGRYCYQKNQRFVLKVFCELRKTLTDAKLYLVGFGEDEEILKKDISELELSESVEMIPGNQVDVLEYYAKSDYMIFPSNFEGFGIVLIEAQAMGCYCFASDAIQKEADAGYLRILPLKEDASFWSREILSHIMSGNQSSMDRVLERLNNFDEKRIADQYAEIYNGK